MATLADRRVAGPYLFDVFTDRLWLAGFAAMTHNRGIILFAHGSRDPLWHLPMQAIAARMAAVAPDTPVVCAYLEHSEPDLAQAMQQLVQTGVDHVTILPLFMGVGKHVREDLPGLMTSLSAQHPAIQLTLLPAIGDDARFVALAADIALQGQ
jgi:sirohydrochlorin cobaltochelatase